MYLLKTKRVNRCAISDYILIDNIVCDVVNSIEDAQKVDLVKETGLSYANDFLEEIAQHGEAYHWYSIFQEIGYWRKAKANHIYKWFVDNVQNGRWDCDVEVTKEHVKELYSLCKKVLESRFRNDCVHARDVLPVFDNSCAYNDDYYGEVEKTLRIMEETLYGFDFEKEILIYTINW